MKREAPLVYSRFSSLFCVEVLKVLKIKMLVQTQYKSELLRQGKIYDINEETAKRWLLSKLAEPVKAGKIN